MGDGRVEDSSSKFQEGSLFVISQLEDVLIIRGHLTFIVLVQMLS